MENIKPCPFCGEDDMIEPVVYENRQRGVTRIFIKCVHCCATGAPVILFWPATGEEEEKALQKAWDRWNARADDGL